MKKLIAIIGLLSTGAMASLDWNTCLEYKFPDAPKDSWTLMWDGNPDCHIVGWGLTNPIPTRAELVAIEPQAIAWKKAKEQTEKSDYEAWKNVDKDSLVALVKVLLDEINILRDKAGLPPRTKEQLKAAIKGKLE